MLCAAGELDVAGLQALWNETEINRVLFEEREVSLESVSSQIKGLSAHHANGLGIWTVRLRKGGDLVGSAGLLRAGSAASFEPRLSGLLEPVIAIDAPRRRDKLGIEVLDVVLACAFETLAVPVLAASVDAPVKSSQNLLNKRGFTLLSEVIGWKGVGLRTYLLSVQDWRSHRSDAHEA